MSMRCLRGLHQGLAVAALLVGSTLVPQARGQEPSNPTIDLPATVSEIEIGGSGKYLIMHFSDLRKLAVFDFSQRKVVKYISVNDSDVKFAAGAEKLFVYLGGSGVISRYDPKTLKPIAVRIQDARNLASTPKGLFDCGDVLRPSADGRREWTEARPHPGRCRQAP